MPDDLGGRRIGPAGLIALLSLAAVLAISAGSHLVGRNKSDELYYMRAALEMLRSGNYVYPVYDGVPRFQKPPAAYWTVALSYYLFGVSLFTARLPTVLLAVLAAYLTYRLAIVLFRSRVAGLFSACALLSSGIYYRGARLAMADMLLTCAILAAFLCFAGRLFSGWRWGSVLGWVCVALAALAKGPVGLCVPVVTLAVYLVTQRGAGPGRVLDIFPPLGGAALVAIVGSWAVAAWLAVDHTVVLGQLALEAESHLPSSATHLIRGPVFYVSEILRELFPWSILLLFYFGKRAWPSPIVFLMTWAGTSVAISSFLIENLRFRHLLPAMPALALLAGNALWHLYQSGDHTNPLGRIFAWGYRVVPAVAALLGAVVLVPVSWRFGDGTLVAAAVGVTTAGLIGVASVGWLARRHDPVALACGYTLVALAIWGAYFGGWWPNARVFAHYEVGRQYIRGLAPDQALAAVGFGVRARTWLVLGAGHEMVAQRARDHDAAFARLARDPPDVLVVAEAALSAMPDTLRRHYRSVTYVARDDLLIEPKMLLGKRPKRARGRNPDQALGARVYVMARLAREKGT